MNRLMLMVVLAGAGLAVGGCGGSDSCPAGTGSILLDVTGVPAGSTAAVHIHGGSVNQTFSANATVTLPSGTYAVDADLITISDPLIRTAYKGTASSSSAAVCNGTTTSVTVGFAQLPTSNRLWFGNQNASADLLGWNAADLGASGSPAPAISATTAGAQSEVFDRLGNVWVANGASVYRYPAEGFAASGAQTADITVGASIFGGGVPGVGALTFDSSGNLWVSVPYANEVVRLDAASLAASGTANPTVTIAGHNGPLAFDTSGTLWIAGTDDHLVGFTAAHLAASPTAPDVDLTLQGGSGPLSGFTGLAFDLAANLWVTCNGAVVRLVPADRAASGSVTPGVVLHSDVLGLPEGLAFDEGGGLWLALAAGQVGRYSAAQLAASTSDAPATILQTSAIGSARSPALFPAPAGLPLQAAIP